MRRQDFHFDLPEELIAQVPLPERTASRLMLLDGNTGRIEHSYFAHLTDYLRPEDLLVFNNTRVIPARLFGLKQSGGRVEVLIERVLEDDSALAHVRASKAPKAGTSILITKEEGADVSEFSLQVMGRQGDLFLLTPESASLAEIMRRYGHMPLPPYIDRSDNEQDVMRYQTVYARREGAVAAPTAGLHFDQLLLDDIRAMGVATTEVTLHVAAGTFQPVRAEDVRQHKMHSEWLEVGEDAVAAVRDCRDRNGRVIAVGTTAVRSLETAAMTGELSAFRGESSIFLYPGKAFHVTDAMITNFHLPESTLIMLVAAFAGHSHTMASYREAVRHGYRFFSYGDAMLITPQESAAGNRMAVREV